jgi:hypothetical protein
VFVFLRLYNLGFIIVILILSYYKHAEARKLEYTFFVKSDCVRIRLCVNSLEHNSTQFLRPLIIGMDNRQDEIIETEINDVKSTVIIEAGDYFTIKHNPQDRICSTFNLHNFTRNSNLYFYHLQNNLLLLGNYALPIVTDNINEIHDVTFAWKNYSEPIISNFGMFATAKLFKVKATNKTLENSFFIGGDFRVENIQSVNEHSQAIFFSNFPFNREQIVGYIKKIQKTHYTFYKPTTKKDYYIFLTDPKYPIDSEGTRNETPEFSYQAITLGRDLHALQIQSIIAHEHLHKLFGYIIKQDINLQSQNSWFMEGITNYYTAYLNYKGGLWSLKEYIENYNNCLYKYFSSELNVADFVDIDKNPIAFGNIPYLRGQILGHELDYELKKISKNKFSLDSYINYLTKIAYYDDKFEFSLDTFKKTLSNFADYNADDFIQQNILKSYIVIKAQEILEGKAKLVLKKMPIPRYGFNLFDSFLHWKIKGIKKSGNAYKNGLRNGQKILSAWFPSDLSKKMSLILEINDNHLVQTIEILPEYQEIVIPQYQLLFD